MPVDVQPLGELDCWVGPALGILLGAGAVLAATALMELSRTLAERYRGRWFAGNGRDIFHAGAVGALGLSFRASGLPSAMAFLSAATAALFPLLLIDQLPARRRERVALLFALFALGAAPMVLEPGSIVSALNLLARAVF